MKYIFYFVVAVFLFSACANVPEPKVNYIGVTIPDFKNSKIDSLVNLYEEDREFFYKAQETNDMQAYYKNKVGKTGSYNVTGFYDDVIRILNMEKDTAELNKFQDYISESSTKARAFIEKVKN